MIARGLPAGTAPDSWTLDRPDDVAAVHRSYVDAGSDAIHANTFGANGARLERFGLADRIEEVNRTAVRLARDAGAAFVIADIGPTGDYLPPVGDGDAGRWRSTFARQAEILADTPVDAFHIETMTDVREALVAMEALREVAPDIPILVSLAFERKKKGFFTIMGDPLVPTLTRLAAAGAVTVGANCGIASTEMRALAEEVLCAAPPPLEDGGARFVFQPNAGQPQVTAEGVHYAQTPAEFADDLAALFLDRRVAALGGCCGTNPRFIAALRARQA